MAAVPHLYDTQGQVVGYMTGGTDPNNIQGVIYWTTAEPPLVGKAFIGFHANGTYRSFLITSVSGTKFPMAITAKDNGPVVGAFAVKPFGSPQSALTYLNNMLPVETAGVRPLVTAWAAAAGVAGLLLLLSK